MVKEAKLLGKAGAESWWLPSEPPTSKVPFSPHTGQRSATWAPAGKLFKICPCQRGPPHYKAYMGTTSQHKTQVQDIRYNDKVQGTVKGPHAFATRYMDEVPGYPYPSLLYPTQQRSCLRLYSHWVHKRAHQRTSCTCGAAWLPHGLSGRSVAGEQAGCHLHRAQGLLQALVLQQLCLGRGTCVPGFESVLQRPADDVRRQANLQN